jgi:hypothetical protein
MGGDGTIATHRFVVSTLSTLGGERLDLSTSATTTRPPRRRIGARTVTHLRSQVAGLMAP